MTAKELTRVLLVDYDILIKDLSSIIRVEERQFTRIAIRNSFDNDKFIEVVNMILRGIWH